MICVYPYVYPEPVCQILGTPGGPEAKTGVVYSDLSLALLGGDAMPINNASINALVRKAKAEGKDGNPVTDDIVKGLCFLPRKSGRGSWYLRYSFGGKKTKTDIGQYPVWSIAEAREEAKAIRRRIDSGINPALEKAQRKADERNVWNVDQLAQYYFDLSKKDLAEHTHKQRIQQYAKYIKPRYGAYPVDKVKPSDIGDNIRAVADAGKTLPRSILILWTQLYHHAVGQGMVESNPCRDIRAETIVGKSAPPKPRTVLKPDELTPLLQSIHMMPRPYELAVRLLLLTGCRISQLTEAKADEFDLEAGVWRIPHERRKNRRFTVGPDEKPLPTEAVEWVRELKTMQDRKGYLFPLEGRRHTEGRTTRSKRTTIGDWLDRIHAECGSWQRITPHDVRAMCKTYLAELRIDSEVRQEYLDHAKANKMDSIYDKAELADAKADAARRLLAYLDRLESQTQPQKVVSIR